MLKDNNFPPPKKSSFWGLMKIFKISAVFSPWGKNSHRHEILRLRFASHRKTSLEVKQDLNKPLISASGSKKDLGETAKPYAVKPPWKAWVFGDAKTKKWVTSWDAGWWFPNIFVNFYPLLYLGRWSNLRCVLWEIQKCCADFFFRQHVASRVAFHSSFQFLTVKALWRFSLMRQLSLQKVVISVFPVQGLFNDTPVLRGSNNANIW